MGNDAQQAGHSLPTMSSSQKALHDSKLDRTTNKTGPKPGVSSRVRGQARNPATALTSNAQGDMPCSIGMDEIATTSAHEYFHSKLEHESAGGTNKPKSSTLHDKDSAFYEGASRDYNLLIAFRNSSFPLSSLIHDRFLNLDSPCAAPNYEPPSAVKVHNFGVDIQHTHWETPPESLSKYTTLAQPFSCNFWLTVQALNQDVRAHLKNYTCVLGGRLVLPYLTVDFRSDLEKFHEARRRAACNANQALYNRWSLYMKTRNGCSGAARTLNKALHCHFMIIFDDRDAECWQLTPDQDKEWTGKGCTMKQISSASLLVPDDLKELHEWINEIHYWAATKYGPACAEEIRTRLQVGNATNDSTAARSGGVAQ